MKSNKLEKCVQISGKIGICQVFLLRIKVFYSNVKAEKEVNYKLRKWWMRRKNHRIKIYFFSYHDILIRLLVLCEPPIFQELDPRKQFFRSGTKLKNIKNNIH
jgi:hypothetical protein